MTTLIAFGIAITTPPLSGELCQEGCIGYPYLESASRFPRDYFWMFPAILATLFYIAFMLSLQARARPGSLLAQLAVVLGNMGALTLSADYAIQLTVIQPSLLAHEADGVAMLSQYNPHGIFIALEELGYALMSAALGCSALALPRATPLDRAVSKLFLAGSAASTLAFIWFLTRYGHSRGYLLEITIISIVWLTLIPGAFMMAALFRRDRGTPTSTGPSSTR